MWAGSSHSPWAALHFAADLLNHVTTKSLPAVVSDTAAATTSRDDAMQVGQATGDIKEHMAAAVQSQSNGSMCEAVVEAALSIKDTIDGPFASFRDREVRSALGAIALHLACCRVDDLPARAVMALADAWLAALCYEDGDDPEAMLEAAMESDR